MTTQGTNFGWILVLKPLKYLGEKLEGFGGEASPWIEPWGQDTVFHEEVASSFTGILTQILNTNTELIVTELLHFANVVQEKRMWWRGEQFRV